MGNLDYHLAELSIARDPDDPRRVLPDLRPPDRVILDLGCGAGQSFVAMDCPDRVCVGLDLDAEALAYGQEHFGDRVSYVRSDAAGLPFASGCFDLVYSRYALPYTNVPRVLREVHRVLKPTGRFWFTIHSRQLNNRWLLQAVRTRNPRWLIHRFYTLVNGYALRYAGVLVPFLNGTYESWQDPGTMRRLLARCDFDSTVTRVGRHSVIEAVPARSVQPRFTGLAQPPA